MPNTTAAPPSAFWEFSLALYARPGVAAACLELQDHAGADVNVMFYLLFLAGRGRQLSGEDVARIDALVATWREQAVRPLRTLRRALKTGIEPFPVTDTETLRSAIKRIELDAEHIQQDMLERLMPATGIGTQAASSADAARANLAAYQDVLGKLSAAAIATLLDAYGATATTPGAGTS